jgi:ribosomal protein L35
MKTKMKSKGILLKRLRITKNGKLLRKQGFKRHLNAKKSSSRKRALGRTLELNEIYAKKVRKIMGIKKATSK